MKKYPIDQVVHLGDLVDNRKTINHRSLRRMKDALTDPLCRSKKKRKWIIGNHDSFYKDNLSINAQKEYLPEFEQENVVTWPIEDKETSILYVPWICKSNREECIEAIQTSQARFCIGHFELVGFKNNGNIMKNGDVASLFKNFELVISGHYHERSAQDNIRYIASCFHFNWGDYGGYRGFAVLDTDTGKIDYFRNPYNMFTVIEYRGPDTKYEHAAGTYCRIYVKDKGNEVEFNDFVKKVEDLGTIDLTIVDETVMRLLDIPENVVGDDLHMIITNYLEAQEFQNPEIIKTEMDRLYNKARG